MKFPLSEINRKDYLDLIFKLLQDDDCQVFVDTNIFALFYRINNSARTEFFDWLKTLVIKDRVKTPLWALNEYTNRFIRNQIEDYFGPLKKVKSIQNDFNELSTFLKMNIDSTSIVGSKYGSLEDFKNDLELINEKLSNIKQTTKSKDETYKLKIHSEIKALFEQTVLESDLENILKITQDYGEFRYKHKLPPGFQDSVKEQNSFGDLIIWNEIINHCGNNDVKKGILITNDLKKDWVYPPNKIIENSRSISNKDGQFKIIDPRLVYEFKSKTSSEEFHIISFDTLAQILLHNTNGNFIELAKALQIEFSKKTKRKSEEDEEETITEQKESDVIPEIVSKEEAKTEQVFNYAENALSDIDFPLNDSSFLIETIINLKSYNWYVQNPAIDKLLDYPEKKIEHNDDNKNKLFVIGRNIYQSAQGGSASAVHYIRNLRTIFTKFSDFYINHVFIGMLYEIYFNSSNEFRAYNYKSSFLDELYSLENLDRLKTSFEVINGYLKPYEAHLPYLPLKNIENISIKIELEGEVKIVEQFWGDEKIQTVSSIMANGDELITANPEISIMDYHYLTYDLNINGLLTMISNVYGIPTYKINNLTAIDEDIKLQIEPKKLKKLATTKN